MVATPPSAAAEAALRHIAPRCRSGLPIWPQPIPSSVARCSRVPGRCSGNGIEGGFEKRGKSSCARSSQCCLCKPPSVSAQPPRKGPIPRHPAPLASSRRAARTCRSAASRRPARATRPPAKAAIVERLLQRVHQRQAGRDHGRQDRLRRHHGRRRRRRVHQRQAGGPRRRHDHRLSRQVRLGASHGHEVRGAAWHRLVLAWLIDADVRRRRRPAASQASCRSCARPPTPSIGPATTPRRCDLPSAPCRWSSASSGPTTSRPASNTTPSA